MLLLSKRRKTLLTRKGTLLTRLSSVPNKLEPILIRCKPACISRSRPISETSSLTIFILIRRLFPASYIPYTGAGLLPYTLMLEFYSVTSNSKTDITLYQTYYAPRA